MDRDYEQINALFPTLINGKTRQELAESIAAADKQNWMHFVDGIKFPPTVQPSTLEALKTFEVRDDDVYIFTFPRSGTHWSAEILHFILNDGKKDFDRAFMTTGLDLTLAADLNLAADPSSMGSVTPGYKTYAEMESPRCILGHCLEGFLPPGVFTKKAKVVYVARNPKDVLVSFQQMAKAFPPYLDLNLDEFLWNFSTGQFAFGSWYDHVLNYWKHKDDSNFLFLKYEDLHKDLRGSIGKLAKFVGKDLSDDVIDDITDHVTFAGMTKTYKQLEDEGGEHGKFMTHAMGIQPYLRKGKVGDWKNTFTVAQSALFDKVYALKMQGTGLEFDFEL